MHATAAGHPRRDIPTMISHMRTNHFAMEFGFLFMLNGDLGLGLHRDWFPTHDATERCDVDGAGKATICYDMTRAMLCLSRDASRVSRQCPPTPNTVNDRQ